MSRFVAGAAIAAIAWATGSANAQCPTPYPPYPGAQLDYDFLLGTLDEVLGRVLLDPATNINLWTGIDLDTGLPDPGTTPLWTKIPGQVGPGFTNADNWGNNIHDDDHLDFLAAILDGDASVVAGIPGATVTDIRADFLANRALIATREVTLSPVAITVTALGGTCSRSNFVVTTGSSLVLNGTSGNILICPILNSQNITVDVPSLWSTVDEEGLLYGADPLLEQYLLDLGAAILTIGDPEGVAWFQDLLGEVTLEFVKVLIPGLLADLKTYDEFDVDVEDLQFGDEKVNCVPPPPNIFVDLSGLDVGDITLGNPSNISMTGANVCANINTFVSGFSCTNFACNNATLGSSGNVTGSGPTNLSAYVVAGGNRQDWMVAKGIANPPLQITSTPADVGVLAGQSANMSFTVVGSPTSYSWETMNPANYASSGTPRATTAALSIPYAVPGDSGLYSGIACDTRWTRRTLPATLAVSPQAFAVTQQPTPSNPTVLVGSNQSFTTNVTGGYAVPTFQWRRGVVNIDGVANPSALTNTLQLTNIQLADAGPYNCVITGDDGSKAVVSLTTNNTTLTVLNPLVIGTQPVGANIVRGGGHVLTVGGITGGTGNPVNYQWQRNGVNLTNNPNLSGATTNTLTISNALFTQQGNYRCVVTDPTPGLSQSVTSTAVAVTVLGISSTGNLPLFVSTAVGAPVSLTVVPVGGAVATPGTEASPPNPSQYTYQWEFDPAPASGNWVTLGSFTTNNLTIATAAPADSGKYRVTVRDTALVAVTSSETNVSVSSNPIIVGTQPQGAGRLTGSSVTFNATATGGAPTPNNLTFVWYRNGSPITIGGDVSENNTGTTSSLTINNLDEASHAGAIFCRVSDAQSQIVDTNTVQLYVGDPLVATGQPTGANLYVGSPLVLEVSSTGGVGPVTYQWFQGATPVGLDSPTLDLSPATPLAIGTFTCQISDIGVGDGNPATYTATVVLSDAADVNVASPLQLLAAGQPQGANVPEGGTVNFTVSPTGGFPGLDYQWFDTSKAALSGENGPTLSLAGVAVADSGGYYCEITDNNVDGSATVTSATAQLTVSAPLVALSIVGEPVGTTASVGDTAFFTVAATGGISGNYNYQWRKNGVDISGANGPVLLFTAVAEADAGDYDCVVVDNLETVISNAATLSVLPALPVFGGLGIAALMAAIAAAGALRKRRK